MIHLMEIPDDQLYEPHRYYAYLVGITGDDESVYFDAFSFDNLVDWKEKWWEGEQDDELKKRLRKVGSTCTPMFDIGEGMTPKIAFHPNVLIILKLLEGLSDVAVIEEWCAKSIVIADLITKETIELSPYDNRFLNIADLKRTCLEFRKSIITRQCYEAIKDGGKIWRAFFGRSSQD